MFLIFDMSFSLVIPCYNEAENIPILVNKYRKFLRNKKNELVWQGIGKGYIYNDKPDNKNEKIKAMVNKILLQFPPE